MAGPWLDLWRDRRGVSAIEFALVGPVVLLLIAAVVEASLLWSGATALDSGSRAAARYGLTGAVRPDETRTDVVRRLVTEQVCPRALDPSRSVCFWAEDGPRFVDEDDDATPLDLQLKAYADPRNLGRPEPWDDRNGNGKRDPGEEFEDLNGNGVWDADTGVAGPGGPADLVVYEIAVHQGVTNPLLRAALGGRTVRHETRIVIRNEPF
ncbi:MAG: TadE/TadG family type IV pilus assembly protein [Alphaproteobacteria bacterium]